MEWKEITACTPHPPPSWPPTTNHQPAYITSDHQPTTNHHPARPQAPSHLAMSMSGGGAYGPLGSTVAVAAT